MKTYTIFYRNSKGKLGTMEFSIKSTNLTEVLWCFEKAFVGYHVAAIVTPDNVTYSRFSESGFRKVK